jgi:PIN domain
VRTNIVLIDSENVKPESIEKLKHDHFRVVVFVGANQKRIDFSVVAAVQSLASNGSYVQIVGNGPNALDFHIAYYIGRLAVTYPDAYFHIISGDKGFDPLIKHLKEQKIFCSRSASITDIPIVKSTDKLPPKERAADFYEKRLVPLKARPATIKTLQSAILSHFYKFLSPEDVGDVIEALKEERYIVINGNKVAYPERG